MLNGEDGDAYTAVMKSCDVIGILTACGQVVSKDRVGVMLDLWGVGRGFCSTQRLI